jgi:hypothetical protein
MAVFNVGSQSVVVSTRSQNYWFFRKQGIKIEVSPDRHWWCLWLCSSTTSIDAIQCYIHLTGVAPDADATNKCSSCGSLDVMGPAFWGLSVPQPFQSVAFEGTVQISGTRYPISGTLVY